MSLTVKQATTTDGFPKPAELIEITGAAALEAQDRIVLNVLYQHAHDSGQLTKPGAKWQIPAVALRTSKHESNDRLGDTLLRLMQVVVHVSYTEPTTGEPRILVTHLFNFFDRSASGNGTVRFGIPEELAPVLAASGRWGRIKAATVCAMTSKYAIALYELVQLRANMDRCVETFPIERFRELMGVPKGTYQQGKDFIRFVLDVAALEVNGLSDYGVQIEVVRRHSRAPITAVTLAWWRKEGDAYRAALHELKQSKLGRRARLQGPAKTTPAGNQQPGIEDAIKGAS